MSLMAVHSCAVKSTTLSVALGTEEQVVPCAAHFVLSPRPLHPVPDLDYPLFTFSSSMAL